MAKVTLGKMVRVGTYGDPAAIPVEVWGKVLANSKGHTGYTHQWRNPKFKAFSKFLSASCESAKDVTTANRRGWKGTFRVFTTGEDIVGMHCPADKAAGGTATCVECGACNGTRNVGIYVHGMGSKHYQSARKSLPVLNT